jgi:hypothetical protein
MGTIVIKCPTTGKEINTGVGMDKRAFKIAVLDSNSIKCPHCSQTHVWSKKDAILKE